jgi:Fe-S-cluster containining protein
VLLDLETKVCTAQETRTLACRLFNFDVKSSGLENLLGQIDRLNPSDREGSRCDFAPYWLGPGRRRLPSTN